MSKPLIEYLNEIIAQKRELPKIPGVDTGLTLTVDGRDISIHLDKTDARLGYEVVFVNTKFDTSFQKQTEFYIGPNGTGNAIGKRYTQFGEWIKNSDFVTASEASVNANGSVMFGNGRHRYAWFRDNRASKLPIAMDAESIKYAKQYGYIK